MAVLQKMREKFGIAISVIIALSLLYFIAPMDDLMTLFGRPQNVGEVNGRGISYEDFAAEVEKYNTISEISTGTSAQNEQAQQQVRNMAWQSFLDEYMFIKNAKAAGFKVGNAEAADIVLGAIPEDQITELSTSEDARIQMYWQYIQNSVAWQQYHIKYNSLFAQSAVENALTLADAVAQNNTTVDYECVTVPYTFAPDSTIKVSGSEIKSYYKAHKKDYKQTASRDIEYVVFEVTPSEADIQAASQKMDEAYAEFKTTDNMKTFLLKNSDRSLSDRWYKKGELNVISSDVNTFAFSNAKGVSPIYKNGNTYYAAKVMESAMRSDSVYVKHILLQGENAKAEADSLLKVVTKNPGQFSTVAMLHSADQGSQADGEMGNIGWLTQTYMIPGFESVLTAQTGKPFVLTTQYGTHVVLVSKKTSPVMMKKVAILEKTVLASKETFNTKYSEANKFASIAEGSVEGYMKAVDSLGVYSHNFNGVLESTDTYGSIDQAKEITRWIFDAKKAGKASAIITVNNNYFFVVALKAIHKDGYTPVQEVASQIRQTLYAEKRGAAAAKAAAEKIEGLGTLEEIASALGSTVESRKGISFSAMNMGMAEPALLGAVYSAPIDEIGAPVAGIAGVYVYKVTARETGSFYTEQDARNFATQKAQYNTQMLVPVMMEAADVQDNRARYY
ncbi:MAG: SurA N-terminal domain-containing protein [Bacteroidales bacterium]|nr:SurA N-terminal domain-containing protein [Candidatus Cryptobacteroides aphodequi]